MAKHKEKEETARLSTIPFCRSKEEKELFENWKKQTADKLKQIASLPIDKILDFLWVYMWRYDFAVNAQNEAERIIDSKTNLTKALPDMLEKQYWTGVKQAIHVALPDIKRGKEQKQNLGNGGKEANKNRKNKAEDNQTKLKKLVFEYLDAAEVNGLDKTTPGIVKHFEARNIRKSQEFQKPEGGEYSLSKWKSMIEKAAAHYRREKKQKK